MAITLSSYCPNDVVLHIFSFLSPSDLSRCARVSKLWNTLSEEGALWRCFIPNSFQQDPTIGCKENFKIYKSCPSFILNQTALIAAGKQQELIEFYSGESFSKGFKDGILVLDTFYKQPNFCEPQEIFHAHNVVAKELLNVFENIYHKFFLLCLNIGDTNQEIKQKYSTDYASSNAELKNLLTMMSCYPAGDDCWINIAIYEDYRALLNKAFSSLCELQLHCNELSKLTLLQQEFVFAKRRRY